MSKLKHILLLAFFLLTWQYASSQARMVLNGDVAVVMSNQAFIVVENSNANAITTTGTGGRIISENENNRVRWRIGNNTGNYRVPFGRGSIKIPLTMNISAGGGGGNYIDFSTYGGSHYDNEAYMPSMVTHMGQLLAPGVVNHSEKAIDRFWIMNPIGYSSMPTAAITFTYIDDEHTATGNNIDEAKLAAQRFNTPAGTWGDMWPVGTVNTVANTVVTPPIAPTDFFPAWTLSQIDDPLPVELTSFSADCDGAYADIRWVTATETNASHFVVQNSIDGVYWIDACYTEAQGNSSIETHYSCSAEMQRGQINYFRLLQVDFDGEEKVYGPISLSCDVDISDFIVYPNPADNLFTVEVNLSKGENSVINLLDITGKLVAQKEVLLNSGVNQVLFNSVDYAPGTYMIQIISESKFTPKKLILQH